MLYLSLSAQAIVMASLVAIAWYDIRNYKVRNVAVLGLLLLYIPVQGGLGFATLADDLLAGGVLFGIGFLLWLLRGIGAGDAKLMLPLGLHLSYVLLLPFAVLLMAFSILFYLAIFIAKAAGAQRGLGGWLAGLRTRGRLPYALVLALAAVPVLALRFAWLIGVGPSLPS